MEKSELQMDALEAAATSWVGTPWCDGSATKGLGACCHKLIGSVYFEAGWLPAFDFPEGAAAQSRGNDRPIMMEWFTGPGANWFKEVETPEPGDTLLIRVGHSPHHLGLMLRDWRVLHVTYTQGVRIIDNAGQWLRLLANTFRPHQ